MKKSVFEKLPQKYDLLQKQSLPNWQSFFSTVIEYIPEGKVKILEPGSGSGFLTSMIKKSRPEVSITCIDKNSNMIAIAKEKQELKDVNFIKGDILKVFPEDIFDIVLSTQCIFALSADKKTQVFKKIHDCLKPGGMFIEGEIFRPENEWEEMLYRSRWKKYMLKNGLSSQEAEEMLLSMDSIYENLDTLTEFKEKLKKSGFKQIFCPYWYEMYAVLVAVK